MVSQSLRFACATVFGRVWVLLRLTSRANIIQTWFTLGDSEIHLLLPFASSVLVVCGFLCLKRAQDRGVSTWTSMILVCWSCAAVFPVLTLFGGTLQPWTQWWQPAIIGLLFLAGQLFTILAIARGDVSIAAPVLGIKVLIVPAASSLLSAEEPSSRVWFAAAVAVLGIGFVQARDATIRRDRILAAVAFAALAACSMTLFDVLIARWAGVWGAGYFLPLAFGCGGLCALCFVPLADRPTKLRSLGVIPLLVIGGVCMSVQAIGMTFTLGTFGDATRVNIVYSLRGLWGVLFTWLVARHTQAHDAPGHRTMSMRLAGAVLIGISVVISVT